MTLVLTTGAIAAVVLTGLLATQSPTGQAWTVPEPPPLVAAVTTPDAGGVITPPAEPSIAAISTDGAAPVSAPVVAVHERPDTPWVDAAWVTRVATATGIPAPAVTAYADATLAMAALDRGCGLGWTTLAGLGKIESGHGTHGGSVLGADGRPSPPIIGPALDGFGVAAIAATPESTALHGDPRWEHAVGPMQLLPSTWWRWAADGDADGTADPQDLDDAAFAAAGYLCASGRDLSTADAWYAAVLSYNHSDDYVWLVLAAADEYAVAARP